MPDNSDIQIGRLIHAYYLNDRTVNVMTNTIGARFDNSLIDFELFDGLRLIGKYLDYKIMHGRIRMFFDTLEEDSKLSVFDSFCTISYLCGSAVNFARKRKKLLLLYDDKTKMMFSNIQPEKYLSEEDGCDCAFFPDINRPLFCKNDDETLADIDADIADLFVETVALAARDLSFVNLKDAIVFLENNNIPIVRENDQITFALKREVLEEEKNKQVVFTPIVRAAWEAAIKEYENKHMLRKNDKVPLHVTILLKRLSGVRFSQLEEEHPGLSQMLKSAQDQCVPILLRKFPELSMLPKIY